jgi:hypothetical protein
VHLLDSPECGYVSVEGSCDYGNEPSGMIKVRFYDQLCEYLASEEGLGLREVQFKTFSAYLTVVLSLVHFGSHWSFVRSSSPVVERTRQLVFLEICFYKFLQLYTFIMILIFNGSCF